MRLPYTMRSVLKAQWPLLTLILLISIIYFLQSQLGRSFYKDHMAVPSEVVNAWQSLRERDFENVEWYEFATLVTPAFLHGGFDHLFNNMLFLWIFAALAAELIGHRWMIITFLFTAITGNLCHIALNATSDIPCLRILISS